MQVVTPHSVVRDICYDIRATPFRVGADSCGNREIPSPFLMQVLFLATLAALAATGSAGDVVEDKEKLMFKADGTFKMYTAGD